MIEFLWFITGLLLGGCIAVITMCCLQVNRNGYYERTIRKLKDELEKKD